MMKRTVVLLATLLLSFGLIGAQTNVEFRGAEQTTWNVLNDEMTDTVWKATPTYMEMWVQNAEKWGSFTFTFLAYSDDDAVVSISYPDMGGPGTIGNLISSPGGGWDPVGDYWNFMQEYNINNFGNGAGDPDLPDTTSFGGLNSGADNDFMPNASFIPCVQYNYTADFSGDEEAIHEICFEQVALGGGVDFIWGFYDGSGSAAPDNFPQTLCMPLKKRGIIPPEFDGPVNPTAMMLNHCDVGQYTFDICDGGNDDPFMIAAGIVGDNGDGTATLSNAGTWNATTGCLTGAVVTYTPVPADAGSTVTIEIEGCNSSNCTDASPAGNLFVQFQVTNTAPVITIVDDSIAVGKGNTICYSGISADDADACDGAVISVSGLIDGATAPVNAPTWDGTTLCWEADDSEAEHTLVVTVEATDGITTVSDELKIGVLATEPFTIAIEKAEGDGDGVLQGHYTTIGVDMLAGSNLPGGFDFLIGYDASALTFIEAEMGDALVACGWEYFTYRYDWNGNCGNGCPTGLLRIVAIADQNDGPYHPDCYNVMGELAKLTFLVSNDRTYECQYAPVKFYWMDCGDNTMSNIAGDTLWMAEEVYNFYGDGGVGTLFGLDFDYWKLEVGVPTEFPTYFGPLASCFDGTEKGLPVDFIKFFNGGIDIICSGDIDDRGDINMNGISNEIADAVMFTNYFINGLSAFGPTAANHQEGSIAASDVNADGYTLSVADLVYLIRVIIGDALPYPKPVPGAEMTLAYNNGTVSYTASHEVGAALLVFEISGTVGAPEVIDGASGMDVEYSFDGSELRVLVYNIGTNSIAAGENNMLHLPVEGTVRLVDADVATYEGASMDVSLNNIPTQFALGQNYPNPFNPKTNIALSLPVASDYSVAIYNVAGQLVWSEAGYAQAGTKVVEWFGVDNSGNSVASGIYFYKATADSFSATKKMVLMK